MATEGVRNHSESPMRERTGRSLSFSEVTETGPSPEWLDERLLLEKRRCDTDLSMFMVTVLDPLLRETMRSEGLAMLKQLKTHLNSFMSLTHEELKTGSCEPQVDLLQTIQLKWDNSWHPAGRSSITKALLIVSRVARVVAQLDQKPDPYEAVTRIPKKLNSPLSATMAALPTLTNTPATPPPSSASPGTSPLGPEAGRMTLSKSYSPSLLPDSPEHQSTRKKKGGILDFIKAKLTRSNDKSPKRLSGPPEAALAATGTPLLGSASSTQVATQAVVLPHPARPKSVDLRSDQSAFPPTTLTRTAPLTVR